MGNHEDFMSQGNEHAENILRNNKPVLNITIAQDKSYTGTDGTAMVAKIGLNGSHSEIMAALVQTNVQVLNSLKGRLGLLGELMVPLEFMERMKAGLLGKGFIGKNIQTGEMTGETEHSPSPSKCRDCEVHNECPGSQHNVKEQ